MRAFRKYRIYVAVVMAVMAVAIYAVEASADVGEVEICNSRSDFNLSGISINADVDGAQTFTPSGQFVISGVKIPLQHFSSQPDTTFSVHLYPTTTFGGRQVPDFSGGALATSTNNTSVLPNISAVGDTSQAVACSSESAVGTVFEFDATVSLSASTTYAIYVSSGCATSCVRWGIPIQSAPVPNNYLGGRALDVTGGASPATPANWNDYCSGCVDGDSDSGFAIYSNVFDPTSNDIDSWLTNFLTGIGMNGAFGRVLVGSLFAMFVFLILTAKGVPWIISLGIGGLGITFLTAATLLSESILLGMVAIILIGGMGLIMALISGGNRDG